MIIESPATKHTERTQTITAIVIHDSDGHDLPELLKLYGGEDATQSMHYVIASDGNIIKCVDASRKAFHIGESANLHGQRDVNDFSLGIILVVTENDKYDEAQFETLIGLVTDLARDYRIPLNRIVGHDHVESAGDPGRTFRGLSS